MSDQTFETLVCLPDIDESFAKAARVVEDEKTIAEYADPDVLPKLPSGDAIYDGTVYWLTDGLHRLRGRQRAGHNKIVLRVERGTKRDAEFRSLSANSKHGLKRTDADKRKCVSRMLDDPEWSKLTNRKIAEACGVSPGLVDTLRNERKAAAEVAASQSIKPGQPGLPKKADTMDYDSDIDEAAGESSRETAEHDSVPTPALASIKPVDQAKPWAEFEAGIREVQKMLRGAADKLRGVLQYDSSTKQMQSRWAQDYSFQGTVGKMNQLSRELGNGLPVELSNNCKQGYFNERRKVIFDRSAA